MARIQLNHSGVVFNEEEHTYHLNGKELSGITSLLDRQLFPNTYAGVNEAILKEAAEYGTSVHKGCEDFDSQWINDGTQEVADYIQICTENELAHEASEYLITDNVTYASMIDKVYRVNDNTFDLIDIKTYGVMNDEKLQKAKWQLSIYALLFEMQNPKAKVGKLAIIHLRNRMKKDGSFDHISDFIPVNRIPAEICKDLLDADRNGEQFQNPYAIPEDIIQQEETIRTLMEAKKAAEEQLAAIKASILKRMESSDIKTWATPSMRFTRKLPTTRSSFSLTDFKAAHPDIDLSGFYRETQVAGSLLIAV